MKKNTGFGANQFNTKKSKPAKPAKQTPNKPLSPAEKTAIKKGFTP